MHEQSSNSWKIFTTPPFAWEEMLFECERATESIDLEQYIFINDEIGQKFLDLFEKKAKEGVKIRLLCDTAGSFSFYTSSIIKNIEKTGISLQFFNTFIPVIFKSHYTWWFFRDHKKLLVIDRKIAYTGSIPIWEKAKDWRDTFIRFEGNIVEDIQNSFDHMWTRALHKERKSPYLKRLRNFGKEKFIQKKLTDKFQYILNIPRLKKRELYYKMVDEMKKAKNEILIAMPYFSPDFRISHLLAKKAKRNVKVKIILTEKSDHPFLDIAARTYFHELLKSGVEIHLYQNSFFHEKKIIIDNKWTTLGSMNLDNVSLRYNFEANIISTDQKFINDLDNQYTLDLMNSKKITFEEWQNRQFFDKFLEFIVRPIRSFL